VKTLSCVCKPVKKFEGFKQNNYKLYNSSKWRKFAHALRKEFPLCYTCRKEGRTTACQMVDHVKNINLGGSIWGKDNLRTLCNKCHAKKTSLDKDKYKK
jgi:5-methylcytosine-specific restriction endonuclease McrA